MKKVFIYDTTLRDGAQAEGISFTVEDKIKIVRQLDDFGVHYIEAGNPASNPKDLEFFKRINEIKLKSSNLTAFGSTRRANTPVENDAGVLSLLSARTKAVTIFGKSWDFHVREILRTTLEENLDMIKDTIEYMKKNGKEVIFDAEHFFDGYKANPIYSISTLESAAKAGADWIVLCDTNGGCLPGEIQNITRSVVERFNIPVGIHCHNDGGMAAANSIVAVMEGATQVQGTFNGYGERCGNANLCTIIPNLMLKAGFSCIPEKKLQELTSVSRYIDELANMVPASSDPYVGNSAFAHKGGMHIDGVSKNSSTFEHISPEKVGNHRRFLMSEVSGRSTILSRIQKVDPGITKDSIETYQIIDQLKRLEHEGYQFEGAESSFELLVLKALGRHRELFEIKDFKILAVEPWRGDTSASAVIKVKVGEAEEIAAAEGDGPVNALDKALRKVLTIFFPELGKMRLTDYKVRVLDTNAATAARVRVHIESTDGDRVWSTVGVSTNIIEASWKALVDSIEYMLIKHMEEGHSTYTKIQGGLQSCQ